MTETSVEQFFKKSVWSFSSVAVRTVANLSINKIVAVSFGTTGITLFSHFQNLISLLTQVPNDGPNRGLIKYCSNPGLSKQERGAFLKGTLILNGILYLFGIIILLVFGDYVWKYFEFTLPQGRFLILFFVAVLRFILNLFLLSIILSKQHIKQYAIINIASAIVLVLFVIIGCRINQFDILLLLFTVGHALTLILSAIYILKKGLLYGIRTRISTSSFKNLGEFVLMAASVLIFSKLLDFVVRDYAIQEFGFHQTGLWQSVVRLSDGYMMIFINTVGVVYYPQVASMIFDTEQLRNYLQGVFKVIIPVTAVGLIAIYFLRTPILSVLYTSDFISAGELMPYQIIGDFFCILSYLQSYIISAQARTRTFIALQAGSAAIYIGFMILLSDNQGIMALPEAHALRFFIVFVILLVLNKRILF